MRTNVETVTGWEASVDGKVVVGLAVIALLIGLALIAGVRSIVLRLALLALGVWAIVIAIVDIIDVGNQLDSLEPAAGVGLYLVGAAGVVLLLAGLGHAARRLPIRLHRRLLRLAARASRPDNLTSRAGLVG